MDVSTWTARRISEGKGEGIWREKRKGQGNRTNKTKQKTEEERKERRERRGETWRDFAWWCHRSKSRSVKLINGLLESQVFKIHECSIAFLSVELKYVVKLPMVNLVRCCRKRRTRYNGRVWWNQIWNRSLFLPGDDRRVVKCSGWRGQPNKASMPDGPKGSTVETQRFNRKNPKVQPNKPKGSTVQTQRFNRTNPKVQPYKPKGSTVQTQRFNRTNPKVQPYKPKSSTLETTLRDIAEKDIRLFGDNLTSAARDRNHWKDSVRSSR